jgi:hypothetical protein
MPLVGYRLPDDTHYLSRCPLSRSLSLSLSCNIESLQLCQQHTLLYPLLSSSFFSSSFALMSQEGTCQLQLYSTSSDPLRVFLILSSFYHYYSYQFSSLFSLYFLAEHLLREYLDGTNLICSWLSEMFPTERKRWHVRTTNTSLDREREVKQGKGGKVQ